jgi:hypothetical protein
VYCVVLFARHYEAKGYKVQARNLTKDGLFKFRFNTNGKPWSFSYFVVLEENETDLFEIRHNQRTVTHWEQVEDGREPAQFALDVAVIQPGIFNVKSSTTSKQHRIYALNNELITFGEAKNLVAYPMLLASFFGIVHELLPAFVQPNDLPLPDAFEMHPHPYPTMFTSDHFTSGALSVLRSFEDRGLKIAVVENVNKYSEATLLRHLDGHREDIPLSDALEQLLDEVID